MEIGKNIKTLRKERHLTQEQLAEMIKVSPQAISKWETCAGFPDIAQILPLAQALNVTTDKLLGYVDRRAEAEKEWQAALRYGESSKELYDTAVRLYEEFPFDFTFLFRMGYQALFYAKTLEGRDRDAVLFKGMNAAHELLKKFPEEKESAFHIIIQILVLQGKKGEALPYAYQCKDRDYLLELCLEGTALRNQRQNHALKDLHRLLNTLYRGEEEAFLNASDAIVKALFPNENYLEFTVNLMITAEKRALLYAKQGAFPEALAELQKAEKYALAFPFPETRYTIPLFDTLTASIDHPQIDSVVYTAEQLTAYMAGYREFDLYLENLHKRMHAERSSDTKK